MSALSAAAVAAIDDLELAARLVVDGARAGSHRSPAKGHSAEFQEHRLYRPGDDLKYLDWKILARTDRLYSKEFRETTNMGAMIVLDTSASMAYPEGGLSKFRYTCIMAAALAYLIIARGDAVGCLAAGNGRFSYVPAKGGRPHLRSLIAFIDRLEPGGSCDAPAALTRAATLLKRRGVVLALSDFYDDVEATRRALRLVARRGHDVSMLQILSADETAFPFTGDLDLEDLETAERRVVDAGAVRLHYHAAMAGFLAQWRSEARRDGIEHVLVTTDAPPERALRAFLLQRGSPHHHSGHSAHQILE